tara:strand:- start:12119 stop:12529 length:411 start_codon:yes stop_codon:yes gene_type:complete
MITVEETITLPTSAEKAWAIAGPFEGLHVWHPAVTHTEMRKNGDAPQRVLHLDGGGALVETLDLKNSDAMTTAWTLDDGPFPVKNYRAWVSVVEEGDRAVAIWSAEFEANGVTESEARDMIAGAFRAGLDELAARI